MNNYNTFLNKLLEYKMIEPVSEYVLELIHDEINSNDNSNELMILLSIYFSLIADGNICMSLNKDVLLAKWNNKLDNTLVLLEEKDSFNIDEFNELKNVSINIINNYLNLINKEALPTIINDNNENKRKYNKIFEIDNDWLYLIKYSNSRKSIQEAINRLFNKDRGIQTSFSYKDCVTPGFKLSNGQEKAIIEGQARNLIITGGPGTGKTTSILFLLLGLLSNNRNEKKEIYLVAPSGKASSRMKESIIGGLNLLSDEYKNNNEEIINIIKNLEEYTIHRLLSYDSETKAFKHNQNNQFKDASIFIIDEASMIDICLFDSLLSAIPDNAWVFMMGDKNQLPSVECGAVFGDLLKKKELEKNIIELDESIRFDKTTKIYELASAINNGKELPLCKWEKYEEFKIQDITDDKPIYYYYNEIAKEEKNNLTSIIKIWSNSFYKDLQTQASNLDVNDINMLDSLYNKMEAARILCAENESIRGVKAVNNLVVKEIINRGLKTSVDDFYTGELIMITKNNKMLDLYNGDCGILVSFKEDETLYLMVKKSSKILENDGKENDRIFKLQSYVFYPFRMISKDEMDLAYAITIHKSQGSDYKNILVILPKQKGHPLLNRQIVYTAITRTKGITYILSNKDRLEEARDTVIIRDTNI